MCCVPSGSSLSRPSGPGKVHGDRLIVHGSGGVTGVELRLLGLLCWRGALPRGGGGLIVSPPIPSSIGVLLGGSMDITHVLGPVDRLDGCRDQLVPVVVSGEASRRLHPYEPPQSLGEHPFSSFRFQVVFGVVRQIDEIGDVLVNIQTFHSEPFQGHSRPFAFLRIRVLCSKLVEELIPGVAVVVDGGVLGPRPHAILPLANLRP